MSAQVVKYNGSLCQVTNLKFTGKQKKKKKNHKVQVYSWFLQVVNVRK